MNLEKARRETIRWIICLTLNNARPLGADESLILTVIQSSYPDVTPRELRRELDYLEERELIKIERSPDGRWRSELTRVGIDLCDYTINCEPGIARPPKYWEA